MALAVDPNWRPGMPPPTGGPPVTPGNNGGVPNVYTAVPKPPVLQKPMAQPGAVPGAPIQTTAMPPQMMAGQPMQTMGAPASGPIMAPGQMPPARPNPYGRPQMGQAIANRVNNPYASAMNRNVVMPVRGAIQRRMG
jgi:hypothetical protein